MSNKIHTKNKEYYTYFISNDIKEEIEKYSGDEKKEKILENIPEDIILKKSITINNNTKNKNFRNCKLHFTKNNNIVNLNYNGLVNSFSLDDINNIDNNSFVKNNLTFILNNIIGLDEIDGFYRIIQNINFKNNSIINDIILYGYSYFGDNIFHYMYKMNIYYNIIRNIQVNLIDENEQHINLNTDLLTENTYNNDYYLIYTINDNKYYIYYDNDIERYFLKNLNGVEDINISIINLTKQDNNTFEGNINFENIEDFVLLNYVENIGSGFIPYYALYQVDKINKTLTRINNEEVKLCVKDDDEKLYIYYSYNYEDKTLSSTVSFNLYNKSIDDLYDWINYYIIHKYKIIEKNYYEIMNDNYDDKLYSNLIYPPTGSSNSNNINDNIINYYTLFPSIYNQLYYGRYFKQFSAIDPEDNPIIITYKGISPINIIENNDKSNDENDENDENDDNDENDENENNNINEENGINDDIENYYEEDNIEEEIKPKIEDINDDNYFELITNIYRPKTIQKFLIPIQCLYSYTSIINTSNNQTYNNQIINDIEFIKDVSNSTITINIPLNNINTVKVNSTNIKLINTYAPLLILPTGELILKFDELNINPKEYLDYGKSLTEDANITFNYNTNIWMLRKINIPSFSINYDLNLEQMILKNNDDVLDTIDYNIEHYKYINDNLNINFFSKSI